MMNKLTRRFCTLLVIALVVTGVAGPAFAAEKEQGGESDVLRAGLIGLDTSHVIHFTRSLNDPEAEGAMADVRVVAGYPGGSPDIPSSANRVEKYTKQLRDEMGIEIVDSIPSLLEKVDVVLLESVDGRPHLEQAIPVIKAGKPLFIDKPLAGSLADALVIDMLAEQHGVPWFSSSSLRYSPGILKYRMKNEEVGKVMGATAWSPCSLEPHHPDLYWYGIHGVETLYTIMGPGCKSVVRTHTEGAEVVTGVWPDGRIGTFRGVRNSARGYGAMVFGSKKTTQSGTYAGYEPLLRRVAKFFKTHEPPVPNEETLEIYTFMSAADVSKERGGKPVKLEKVLSEARAEAKERLRALSE